MVDDDYHNDGTKARDDGYGASKYIAPTKQSYYYYYFFYRVNFHQVHSLESAVFNVRRSLQLREAFAFQFLSHRVVLGGQ